jgi:hypothetical protein
MDGAIHGPHCWCLKHSGYNVNHTKIIQKFEKNNHCMSLMNSFLLWSLPYEPMLDPQVNLLFLPYFQLSTKSNFQVYVYG